MATKAKTAKPKAAKTKAPKPTANGTPPAPAAEVLTLAEAAAFLRVPADALRGDAAAGRVPGRLVGGDWRFHRAGLLDWLSRPEPDARTTTTSGAELAEHIRKTSAEVPFHETEEEVEAFLAAIYAARKEVPIQGR